MFSVSLPCTSRHISTAVVDKVIYHILLDAFDIFVKEEGGHSGRNIMDIVQVEKESDVGDSLRKTDEAFALRDCWRLTIANTLKRLQRDTGLKESNGNRGLTEIFLFTPYWILVSGPLYEMVPRLAYPASLRDLQASCTLLSPRLGFSADSFMRGGGKVEGRPAVVFLAAHSDLNPSFSTPSFLMWEDIS